MHRTRLSLVMILACLIATGCGSDETESAPERGSKSERQSQADPGERPKLKPNSARAQMVQCIEGAGYEVTTGDDPDKLSLKTPSGKLQAAVTIHSDRDAARKSTVRGQKKGVNAVAFGRAEVVRHAAKDAEAGVIVNCVAAEYR